MVTKKVTFSPEYRNKLIEECNGSRSIERSYQLLRALVIYDTQVLIEGEDVS